LSIQKLHELIFYISLAATKTKEFIEIIKDPARFIFDLKVVYKGIKEINASKISSRF